MSTWYDKAGADALLADKADTADLADIATSGSADDLADGTTNKAYTATEKTKLAAITGTNTGDETTATIKTKLSITTLSGSNTGDQTTVTGNAGTATKLATARNIDGQSFDGSAAITVLAPGTHAATGKTTPVAADELPIVDSAASNVLKKLTWANLVATMKTAIAPADIGAAATADLAGVATSGDYADLIGNAPFGICLYDSGTSTWASDPAATFILYVGGDAAHPPTPPGDNYLWVRDAA